MSGPPKFTSRQTSFVMVDSYERNIHTFYDFKHRIGEPGNFGYAVVAIEKETGEKYAVKVISKSNFKNDQTALSDFKNEVTIMQRLRHPNIISMKDVFEDKSNMYIVMELCEGGELFERIQSKGNYSEQDARDIIQQLLMAIFHMHKNNVAHCDLKPDNFLFLAPETKNSTTELARHRSESLSRTSLTSPNMKAVSFFETSVNNLPKSQTIKLIDFGLSKFMKHRRHVLTSFCGTPYYIAPEVLKGKYNHNCDLWSIGVVMFVLLYGYPPFYADRNQHRSRTDEIIFNKIQRGFDPSIRPGYGSYFPKDLPISDSARNLIAGLLNSDVSKRLTAEEALDHPWITGKESRVMLQSFVLSSLQEFRNQQHFRHHMLRMLTRRLHEQEYDALRKTFEEIDLNGDGCLTLEELKSVLLNNDQLFSRFEHSVENETTPEVMSVETMVDEDEFDMKTNKRQISGLRRSSSAVVKSREAQEAEIEQLFNLVDLDKNGTISYEELLMAYTHKKVTVKEERLFEAFVALDLDNSGGLSLNEIMTCMNQAGIPMNKEQLMVMVADVDQDRNGKIDYEEFLTLMWASDKDKEALF